MLRLGKGNGGMDDYSGLYRFAYEHGSSMFFSCMSSFPLTISKVV